MRLLRLRLESKGRVALLEGLRSDVHVGRAPTSDLVIDDDSISPQHARILVRRRRVILAEVGRTPGGMSRGGERLRAPVVLDAGEPFHLGEVQVRAWLLPESARGLVGERLGTRRVVSELECADPWTRRYAVEGERGDRGELVVVEPRVDDEAATAWRARVERSMRPRSRHLAPVAASEVVDGRASMVEVVQDGLRLAPILEGMSRRALMIPVESAMIALAHLAEGLAAMHAVWGPHGSLEPRGVQVTMDGTLVLLRPGPVDPGFDASLEPFLAPERRLCQPPSLAADAYALGVIGLRLLHDRAHRPTAVAEVCRALSAHDPEARPRDLRAVAEKLREIAARMGIDPTFVHLGRIVRLLAPQLDRALAWWGFPAPNLAAEITPPSV